MAGLPDENAYNVTRQPTTLWSTHDIIPAIGRYSSFPKRLLVGPQPQRLRCQAFWDLDLSEGER